MQLLPRDPVDGKRVLRAIDRDRWTHQRRCLTIHESGTASELDRRTSTTMNEAYRVNSAIERMNAGHREPVVPGQLPEHWGDRRDRSGVLGQTGSWSWPLSTVAAPRADRA